MILACGCRAVLTRHPPASYSAGSNRSRRAGARKQELHEQVHLKVTNSAHLVLPLKMYCGARGPVRIPFLAVAVGMDARTLHLWFLDAAAFGDATV